MEALREATRVRVVRSKAKQRIKEKPKLALWILLDPPADFQTMKAVDLLLAVPQVGQRKVEKTFHRSRISLSKSLGGLTDRQRRELAARFWG